MGGAVPSRRQREGGEHLIEAAAVISRGRQHYPMRKAHRVQIEDVVERTSEEALFRQEVYDLPLFTCSTAHQGCGVRLFVPPPSRKTREPYRLPSPHCPHH